MKTVHYILMVSVPMDVYPQPGFYRSSPNGCAWQNVGNPRSSAETINCAGIPVNPVNELPYQQFSAQWYDSL